MYKQFEVENATLRKKSTQLQEDLIKQRRQAEAREHELREDVTRFRLNLEEVCVYVCVVCLFPL